MKEKEVRKEGMGMEEEKKERNEKSINNNEQPNHQRLSNKLTSAFQRKMSWPTARPAPSLSAMAPGGSCSTPNTHRPAMAAPRSSPAEWVAVACEDARRSNADAVAAAAGQRAGEGTARALSRAPGTPGLAPIRSTRAPNTPGD